MNIRLDEGISTMTVWLSGPMGPADQTCLLELAERIEALPAARCVFNLTKLDPVDGVGLGMLLFIYDSALAAGKHVDIQGLKERWTSLLRVEGLDREPFGFSPRCLLEAGPLDQVLAHRDG
jgi:ABC-type transporter Mla MlaB component